jgi:hypothetical protein
MGGKYADLNALYVGLARSVGLPARHVYGLRIAKSDEGYKSLGLATDTCILFDRCGGYQPAGSCIVGLI